MGKPRFRRTVVAVALLHGLLIGLLFYWSTREVRVQQAIDTFTSAPWFSGFRERITVLGLEAVVRPVANARTWLLSEGWQRHGRLSVHEVPSTA